jgi:hypothetical protein
VVEHQDGRLELIRWTNPASLADAMVPQRQPALRPAA